MATPETSVTSCHICGAAVDIVPGYEMFRRITSDCKPWPAGGQLCVCQRCDCIQKVTDQVWQSEISQIYADYSIYYQSDGVEQAVFDQNSGQASLRSARLLERLQTELKLPKTGRLLDVGCGNGGLLRTFSSLPGWSLAGTELNDKYRPVVESIRGVESLYTCPPDQVPGTFNLITAMHVLEHIPAPHTFLTKLANKLETGGLLVIEVPDHLQNPFDLLIADHSTHFTTSTLTALVENVGYQVQVAATDWLPKELTIVACKDEIYPQERGSLVSADGISSVTQSLQWLQSLIGMARELATMGNFGVFGTSIAATWLFSELADSVNFFVDEDPSRVGKTHLGRPIYHPSQVPSSSHVFIALPIQMAVVIKARLEQVSSDCSYYTPPSFPN